MKNVQVRQADDGDEGKGEEDTMMDRGRIPPHAQKDDADEE